MIHIRLKPDASVEPGHQFLELPNDEFGRALASLLTGIVPQRIQTHGNLIAVAHDDVVDDRIVALINELAHVRFQSPTLLQLTMQAAASNLCTAEDGGLEGA